MNDICMRDVLAMLKDSGSTLLSNKNHFKYQLPNGRIFTCAKTPSDYRGVKNCIARLRKELRPTHPAIADRGRNTRKRSILTTTLGDLAAFKGLQRNGDGISPFSAVPGSEPSPVAEVEFEVVEATLEVEVSLAKSEVHRSPRKPREEKPKPTSYRKLTPEQMEEANRILHGEGDAAMNTYISACKTEEHPVERKRFTPLPQTAPSTEDDFMSDLLQRAHQELEATSQRIANYESQIMAIKTQQESDILRQAQLEQYIGKHEALAKEAAELLQVLPPKPIEVAPRKAAGGGKKRGPNSTREPTVACGFGLAELRKYIFPELHGRNFNSQMVIDMAREKGLPAPYPSLARMGSWLFSCANRVKNPEVERAPNGNGYFRLKEEMPLLPPAIPLTELAHA